MKKEKKANPYPVTHKIINVLQTPHTARQVTEKLLWRYNLSGTICGLVNANRAQKVGKTPEGLILFQATNAVKGHKIVTPDPKALATNLTVAIDEAPADAILAGIDQAMKTLESLRGVYNTLVTTQGKVKELTDVLGTLK